MGKKVTKTKKYELIMGLKDKDTKTYLIDKVEAVKLAYGIVTRYYDGATIYSANGVYKHDDGTVVFEDSLKFDILVFDLKNDHINELIAELKKEFNQESIAMQTSDVVAQLV